MKSMISLILFFTMYLYSINDVHGALQKTTARTGPSEELKVYDLKRGNSRGHREGTVGEDKKEGYVVKSSAPHLSLLW